MEFPTMYSKTEKDCFPWVKAAFPKLGWQAYADTAQGLAKYQSEWLFYGAGGVGERFLPRLQAMGYHFKAVLDKDPAKQGQLFHGVPVAAAEAFAQSGLPVVLGTVLFYKGAEAELCAMGFTDVLPYFYWPLIKKMDAETLFDVLSEVSWFYKNNAAQQPELCLAGVDLPITDRCSLRCKDCSNLMQYFTSPANAKMDEMLRDFDILLNAVEHLDYVNVLGGEPLMNPELPLYIMELAKRDKYSIIDVITDATILPSEDLLRQLQQARCYVRISDYGRPDLQRCDDVIRVLDAHGILWLKTTYTKWQDCAVIKPYGRTAEENRAVYDCCCMKNMPAIKNGAFYHCPFAAGAAALGAIPEAADECIRLDVDVPVRELRRKLRELMQLAPLKACAYCGGRPTEYEDVAIPAAIQAPKPLDYTHYRG